MSALAPASALPASLLEHPLAHIHDQPGLLEQRYEVVWLDDSARAAAPAQQRLHSGGHHATQVERRLVEQEELVVLERAAQIHLEFHALLHKVLHV